jgi:hypothetical protein
LEDNDSADTESEYSLYSDSTDPVGAAEEGAGEEEDDGLPEVAGNISGVIFSPSKSLSSILDKISRGYRRAGSIQRRGPGSSSGATDAANSNSVEEEVALAPLASYFGPCQRMVPALSGFVECLQPQDHMGHPKAFFDPFTEEWTVWWSCCGQGQVLVEAPLPPAENVADIVFCK